MITPDALESLNALGNRRGGQAHPPAELRERDASVGSQLADDSYGRSRPISGDLWLACVEVSVLHERERSITPSIVHGAIDARAAKTLSIARDSTAHASASIRCRPQAYFVGSAIFHYLGPSFAVLLFARVDVLGVAWLRIASAAAIFAALAAALAARFSRSIAAGGR